jgi:hypothetical protein
MTTKILRWMLLGVLSILCISIVAAATPRPLADHQLDDVYAAGFDVQVDFNMDVAAERPESVILLSGDQQALESLAGQGITLTRTMGGGRNTAGLDPNGTYVPNLQNLTNNTINLSGNALQNATSLLNIFALEGDVAVGLNLNVVVNPVNSPVNVSQMNLNWGTLNLSNALPTFASP